MRGWRLALRLLAAALALAFVLCAPWAWERTPVDPRGRLEGEKPPWKGVLTVALVESFPCEGAAGWLNAWARALEKRCDGLLLSVRTFNVNTYRELKVARALPDVLLLSTGVESEPDGVFLPVSGARGLRQELTAAVLGHDGTPRAVPVAMGGYGLLANLPLLDGMQLTDQADAALLREGMEKLGKAVACPGAAYTRPESAFAAMTGGALPVEYGLREKLWPEFVLEQKHFAFVATQRELRRMVLLQSAGRGFETMLLPVPQSFTDQVLALAIPDPAYTGHQGDRTYRLEAAGHFAALLLCEEAQLALRGAGLFSVREGLRIYGSGADPCMAALEEQLLREGLMVGEVFT